MIRLLDQIKTYPFPNFSLWQILAILEQVKKSTYTCNSKSIAAESKTIAYEGKGEEFEKANVIGDTDVFVVVPIGGAIVHPP